ncbi:MAG TPA: FMN-binding negative transcriptional regulator [Lysobacter sp.]|nr:FMN-binding negative transcriptional regulator [Lysobacter sp.]
MHRASAFAETDLAALDRLAARDSFVTLITTRGDTPTASHLPVLYSRVDARIELRGHWARTNPQFRQDGAALAIMHGPHAYISPAWYPDKEAQARVPTWNYAVAHLHGRLTTFVDTDALADLVAALSDHHEAAIGSDWKFEPQRESHRDQLRGIIGFRFEVDRVEMTFKLNQNHPQANRLAVAEQLEALGNERDRHVATLMRERLD